MQRRGNSWRLRVSLSRDPITGKRRWRSKTVKGTKREAERELARLIAEADQSLIIGTTATVRDLLDRWQATVAPEWSPSARRQNRSAIDRHIAPLLGSIKVVNLKPADLDWFYSEMRKRPGRGDAPLSPATIRRNHVIIRAALQQAVKWGWIGANPADRASPPKVRPAQIQPPDTASVPKVLGMVRRDDPPLFTYLQLAVSTGARRSQLCGLRWSDVNVAEARILFGSAVVDGDQGIELKEGTKNESSYPVTIDVRTANALADHRCRQEQLAAAVGTDLDASAYVFSFEVDGSRPWRPDGVTHRWIKLRKKAGLDGVRLHDLRHFMATAMLSAGVPVSVVAGRLGHSRQSTTLNVYSHFSPAGDRDAADTISRMLSGAAPPRRSDADGPINDNDGSEDQDRDESEDPPLG